MGEEGKVLLLVGKKVVGVEEGWGWKWTSMYVELWRTGG